MIQEFASQLIVQRMAALVRGKRRQQGVAEQIKVAHSVENFVFDELVAVTQAILVQDTEFVENDGVFETATESQAIFAQVFDFLHESKSPGARDITHIGVLGKIDFGLLGRFVDGRVVENNRERQTVAVVRLKTRPFVAIAHFDWLGDADELFGSVLFFNPRRLDQEDEG